MKLLITARVKGNGFLPGEKLQIQVVSYVYYNLKTKSLLDVTSDYLTLACHRPFIRKSDLLK